jgi:dCMP deaminase
MPIQRKRALPGGESMQDQTPPDSRMRPSWHEYFMLIAKIVSSRSTCNSRPTGAVIVKDNHILATGYNGAMPGAQHCIDQTGHGGEPFCFRRAHGIPDVDKYNFCRASHAEANAIAQAARHGIALEGATLYVTLAPCYVCLKLIATARIRGVYYEHPYESVTPERDSFWKEAVRDAGLEVFQPLIIAPVTYDYILADIQNITSRRRTRATNFLQGS